MGGGTAFEAGLRVNGYSRYWHGYQAILRPMLMFYQIHQIRYIQLFVFFGLLLAVLRALRKRMGDLPALAFFVTMICSGIITIPSSMQFMASFVVMMIASLIVLDRYPFRRRENLPLFFMITGMVVNFLDFLTVPLITLGVPLLLCMAIEEDGMSLRGAAACCLAWGLGYALCWVSKWLLSAAVLGDDVFEQVVSHATTWTMGGSGASVDRMYAIRLNFSDFFLLQGMRTMIIPLLPLAGLALCAALCPERRASRWRQAALMAVVCLSPYVWYAVMAAHSLEHHWFVYRAQFITLFGLYMAVVRVIDMDRLRAALCSAAKVLRFPRVRA